MRLIRLQALDRFMHTWTCKFTLVMSPPAAPDTAYGDYVVFGVGMISRLGHEAVEFRPGLAWSCAEDDYPRGPRPQG